MDTFIAATLTQFTQSKKKEEDNDADGESKTEQPEQPEKKKKKKSADGEEKPRKKKSKKEKEVKVEESDGEDKAEKAEKPKKKKKSKKSAAIADEEQEQEQEQQQSSTLFTDDELRDAMRSAIAEQKHGATTKFPKLITAVLEKAIDRKQENGDMSNDELLTAHKNIAMQILQSLTCTKTEDDSVLLNVK